MTKTKTFFFPAPEQFRTHWGFDGATTLPKFLLIYPEWAPRVGEYATWAEVPIHTRYIQYKDNETIICFTED